MGSPQVPPLCLLLLDDDHVARGQVSLPEAAFHLLTTTPRHLSQHDSVQAMGVAHSAPAHISETGAQSRPGLGGSAPLARPELLVADTEAPVEGLTLPDLPHSSSEEASSHVRLSSCCARCSPCQLRNVLRNTF